MGVIDRVIEVAEAEIGYREKKSNADLDSRTANAGSGNYTKFNRDLKVWTGVGSLNAQWCQAFVDWCFIKAFGVDGAKKALYTFTNYTPTGSGAFRNHGRYFRRGAGTPQRGDVIYFYSASKGRIGHVGLVYKAASGKVYTIEGNASDGVNRKSYALTSAYIDGYGRPDYAALEGGAPEIEKPCVEITGSVNVRRGPSKAYGSMGVLHSGDKAHYFGYAHPDNGWLLIEFLNQTGWVSNKYAKVEG